MKPHWKEFLQNNFIFPWPAGWPAIRRPSIWLHLIWFPFPSPHYVTQAVFWVIELFFHWAKTLLHWRQWLKGTNHFKFINTSNYNRRISETTFLKYVVHFLTVTERMVQAETNFLTNTFLIREVNWNSIFRFNDPPTPPSFLCSFNQTINAPK